MTNLRYLLSAFLILIGSFAMSQPTWEVGSTTLTEYDLVTGVNIPWEIAWGPDDHIWCTTRTGNVLRIDPETGTYTEILSLTVTNSGSGEPGLLGMTFHPDWENSPIVFLVYNSGSAWSGNEILSAWEWDGENLVNEDILIGNISMGGIHNGSRLIITPDQKILMTTGDTGDSGESSQDSLALNGKTLRINLDGSIPEDNPNPESYVWSMGHRNSQGLCVGPNGIIYSSEHGQSNADEFNIIEANRNYGWPEVEGECNTPDEIIFCEANNVKEPLKEWSPCVAVNGIEYYNHPAIPEWQNTVLLSVLGGLSGQYERLSVLHMSEDGLTVESEDQYFSSFNQRIRDICVNPSTGAVYVAFNGPSYPGSGPNIIKEFVNEAYVGISKNENDALRMNIYPNPVVSRSTVEFPEAFIGGTYEIISYSGKRISSDTLTTKSMTIDGSKLATGQYYIRLKGKSGIITKTFVVQ